MLCYYLNQIFTDSIQPSLLKDELKYSYFIYVDFYNIYNSVNCIKNGYCDELNPSNILDMYGNGRLLFKYDNDNKLFWMSDEIYFHFNKTVMDNYVSINEMRIIIEHIINTYKIIGNGDIVLIN